MSGFSDVPGNNSLQRVKLSETARLVLALYFEKAGADERDVAHFRTPAGLGKLRAFLDRSRLPQEILATSATTGTDPDVHPEEREAYLQEHAFGVVEYQRRVAERLYGCLMIDGMEQCIQPEDIEALCTFEKRPQALRRAIVRMLVFLRKERSVK